MNLGYLRYSTLGKFGNEGATLLLCEGCTVRVRVDVRDHASSIVCSSAVGRVDQGGQLVRVNLRALSRSVGMKTHLGSGVEIDTLE